jgi:hypothetical protein
VAYAPARSKNQTLRSFKSIAFSEKNNIDTYLGRMLHALQIEIKKYFLQVLLCVALYWHTQTPSG